MVDRRPQFMVDNDALWEAGKARREAFFSGKLEAYEKEQAEQRGRERVADMANREHDQRVDGEAVRQVERGMFG